MGFSGRISLNGLLPSPGPETRIVEGDGRRGAARATGVILRGASLSGAPRVGPAALGECAGWEFTGGGAFRAISAAGPLRSRLTSGISESVSGGVVISAAGAIVPTREVDYSGRALRD
jgi:hypothetical protein